jgi:allene oxide cyclase
MRTKRWALLAAGSVLVVAAGAVGASAGSNVSGPTTIHVIEHANTDAVIDTGATGDTSGDLLTFHNPVFNASNAAQVGHDQGQCIREAPKRGTWECMWTTFLSGGQVTVEGPFYDTKDSVLAVTGGTGRFSNARGQMELKSRAGGTQYDFVFHLTN